MEYTPWTVEDSQEVSLSIAIWDTYAPVARVFGKDHPTRKARASLIVRAVNCHEELLNLIQRALDTEIGPINPVTGDARQWVVDARAALTLAQR